MRFYFDKNQLNSIQNIVEMWDKLGPQIIEAWRKGNFYDSNYRKYYLYIDYKNLSFNSLAQEAFGKELLAQYCSTVIDHFSKTFVESENDIEWKENEKKEVNARIIFKDGDKYTVFQNGAFSAWYDTNMINNKCVEHQKESFKKECQTRFDDEFFAFFVENIGFEFEKAENFFEVELASKIQKNVA